MLIKSKRQAIRVMKRNNWYGPVVLKVMTEFCELRGKRKLKKLLEDNKWYLSVVLKQAHSLVQA